MQVSSRSPRSPRSPQASSSYPLTMKPNLRNMLQNTLSTQESNKKRYNEIINKLAEDVNLYTTNQASEIDPKFEETVNSRLVAIETATDHEINRIMNNESLQKSITKDGNPLIQLDMLNSSLTRIRNEGQRHRQTSAVQANAQDDNAAQDEPSPKCCVVM